MYHIQILKPAETVVPGEIPLWLHPDFLSAVEELQSCKAYHLACYKGEQLVALMPLYEKSRLGAKRLIHPVSAYYQGLWFYLGSSRDANRLLLDKLRISCEIATFLKAHYSKLQFNLTPQNEDVRGFTWSGLKAAPLYTFIHDTHQPLHIMPDERRKLRIAREQGYTLEKALRADEFVSMLKDLHKRKEQVFNLSYPGYAQWMSGLADKGLLAQYNLMKGSELIGSDLMLSTPGSDTAYFVIKCTREEDMKSGASALHSVLMVEELSQTHKHLDFCGANVEQVARFKAALGFRLKAFYQIRN